MDILVILNRESFNVARLRGINGITALKELRKIGKLYVRRTEYPGHAEKIARWGTKRGFDIIVSAGGDGTLNEVVNGMVGTDIPLAIAPLGTSNVFAMELGIPMRLKEAVNVINEGIVKKVDLGFANGRYYTIVAGAGIDGYTIWNLSHEFKKKFGVPYHIVHGFSLYFGQYVPSPINVTADDRDLGTAYQVMVANTSFYGGRMKISPDANVYDGFLDLVLFRQFGPVKDTLHFLGVITSIHHYFKDVEIHKIKNVKLTGAGVYYHLDSEKGGMLPLNIKVAEKVLNVYAPVHPKKWPGKLLFSKEKLKNEE